MNAPSWFERPDGRRLAYHKSEARGEGARRPGIVFLGGLASDMTGTKATFLEGWARERGRAFLRFDYTGHGRSSGRFAEGCVGDWTRDAEDALEALTEGPQVLVGSSMGGWVMLLLAKRRPERVAGLVGVAAAPDFTEDSMWRWMDDDQRETLRREGRVLMPNDHSEEPYVISRRLIEDGRERLVLRSPLPLPKPVRLLHGTADRDVPPEVGLRLLDHAEGPDIRLTLVKDGDHRFSGPRELALIAAAIEEVSGAAG